MFVAERMKVDWALDLYLMYLGLFLQSYGEISGPKNHYGQFHVDKIL